MAAVTIASTISDSPRPAVRNLGTRILTCAHVLSAVMEADSGGSGVAKIAALSAAGTATTAAEILAKELDTDALEADVNTYLVELSAWNLIG